MAITENFLGKVSEKLKPVEPYVDLVLIGFAIICILGIVFLKPEHKTLLVAYLILP